MSGNQPDPNPFSRDGAAPDQGLGPGPNPPGPNPPGPNPPGPDRPGPNRFDTWADGSTPLAQPAPVSQPPPYPATPNSVPSATFPSYSHDVGEASPYADPEPNDEAYNAFRGYQANTHSYTGQDVHPFQGYPAAGPYGRPVSPYTSPVPNSPYAIPALVLGIVGFPTCGFTGPVGLGLGIAALKQIEAEPQRYGGRGLAIAGIITGSIATLFMLLWIMGALLF